MAQTWYTQLLKLAKTDEKAAALFNDLKEAQTDEAKETAKSAAQAYIQACDRIQTPESEVEEVDQILETIEETVVQAEVVAEPVPQVETEEVNKLIFDMSAAAFNPRLAKMGINREEELFLKGVCVRKLSHEDKILMRRSIYNKKHAYMDGKQKEFKKQRAKAMAKAANDPAAIKYHNQRKYVDKIIEALRAHKNFTWMFTNIKGLTPEVMKELLQNQGNVNLFRAEYRPFVEKFNKKYGV